MSKHYTDYKEEWELLEECNNDLDFHYIMVSNESYWDSPRFLPNYLSEGKYPLDEYRHPKIRPLIRANQKVRGEEIYWREKRSADCLKRCITDDYDWPKHHIELSWKRRFKCRHQWRRIKQI